jgi:hypothetical protein
MYKKIAATLIITGFSSIAGAETLLECSRIEDAAERVACYDKVAGRVEEKMEEEYVGTTEQRVEARKDSIAEEVVGDDEPVPELLTLEIKKVIRDRSRRLTYVTTDGRFFRRSPSSMVSFKAGDKCTIKPGVLGSIFLVREDGSKNKVKELSSK